MQLRVSQNTMPEGDLPFLAPEAIAQYCELASMPAEAIPDLQAAANEIAQRAELKQLAWYCHTVLCQSESHPRDEIQNWQSFQDVLGDRAGAFYLLIALSALPKALAFHQSRGMPEQAMRDTYTDTAIWADDYKTKRGVWGMDLRILPWLFNHLSGDLYRLGRLQFMQRPFRQRYYAFRNRETREVVALADAGTTFRGDGQLDGTGGEHDPQNGWISRLRFDSDQVIGAPIHPDGFALKEEVALPLHTWERILAPGDPVLEIHIPAGEPMDFDACGRSFRQAIAFFPRYFPDRPFHGFCCASWLLNTQFQEWLSPNSNIVRFQRELYLFPIFSGGRSGIDRIFGGNLDDLSKAPRDTSLRRAVLEHLERGGYLRGGGALLFAEDLDWGAQVYRRRSMSDSLL
jgi:hypothetical protein